MVTNDPEQALDSPTVTAPDATAHQAALDTLPRRLTALSVGVATAVLAIGLLTSFFTYGPGWGIVSPRGATVATFSGNADQVTTAFRVREDWRIEWQTSGPSFAMAITGDRNLGTVVAANQADSGLTAPPVGGTFKLEIRASGPWTIKVLQGR